MELQVDPAALISVTDGVQRQMVVQLKELRNKLKHELHISAPSGDDELLAAQMVARMLEYYLRPQVIQDPSEVASIVSLFDADSAEISDLDRFIQIFAESGALYRGHFELLSGQHSSYFFMFSKVGSVSEYRTWLAQSLAVRLKGLDFDVIIGPVTAGGLLVPTVAEIFKTEMAFFEIDSESRVVGLRAGYDVAGKRALVINDVTTTGEGLTHMLGILEKLGAVAAGIGLVGVRGTEGRESVQRVKDSGIPVEALVYLNIPALEVPCPLCRAQMPIVKSQGINR
jgi:orotate phosphoribosyltransferase